MPMTAAAATAIAAMSNVREGPSRVSASTTQTLGPHPVGDRAGQGAGDTGDLLHARDDGALQVGQRLGADAHDHVVGAGDVFRRQHAREGGKLLGDDLGAADLRLDQHERLHHPLFPPSRCIDSRLAATKRTAGPASVQVTKGATWQPANRPRPWPGWGSSALSTAWSRAAISRRRWCWDPVTTPRSSLRPTATRWCPPTCWCRAGTSGSTGPLRTTWAARPSRRMPQTWRRWAPGPRRLSSHSVRPRTRLFRRPSS